MTAFKKTILGKILGTAAKVVLPIAGAVTGIGAITGMAKGVGAIAGVKNIVGGAVKGIDAVATKAADLVTGMTEEQRKLLSQQKQEAADAKDKLDFANKLIAAGMDKKTAYMKAGVPVAEMPEGVAAQSAGMTQTLLIGGAIAAGLFLISKLFKKR